MKDIGRSIGVNRFGEAGHGKREKQLLDKLAGQFSSGKFARAAKTARIGIKSYPLNPSFLFFSGLASANLGRHRQAAEFFAQTLQRVPDSTDAQDNYIQALVLSEQFDRADRHSAQFLHRRSPVETLHYLRAMGLMLQDQPEKALVEAQKALDLKPDLPRYNVMKAQALAALGQHENVAEVYRRIGALVPGETYPIVEQTNALARAHLFDAALDVLNAALAARGNVAELFGQRAMIFTMTGAKQFAVKDLKQQIELSPSTGSAYLALATLVDNEIERSDLKAVLLEKITPQSLDSHDLSLMLFALASVEKRDRNMQAEAEALVRANKIQAQKRPYSKKQAEAHFHSVTKRAFSRVTSSARQRPIFIVGLPRSGTTLLERVVSAHPDVTALGEFDGGARISRLMSGHTTADLQGSILARAYLGALETGDPITQVFTDKMPANYKILGGLCAAFPQARVIALTRDPLDIALSNWRAYFATKGMEYAFDLAAMANEFNLYGRYMHHWSQDLNIPILRMSYFDLVNDIMQSSITLAEYCGLEWHEAMAHPEKTSSAILTNSVLQAREIPHTESIGGGYSFAESLAPFIKKLDPAYWPDVRGKRVR